MRHRSTLAGAVVVLALAFPWAGGLAFVLQEAAAAGGGCCNGRQWHGPAGQGQGQATRVRARARQQGIVCSASPKPARTTIPTDAPLVGDPQLAPLEKEYSIDAILKELAEIQRQGPKNYCILGTRHCSFLHQQIIELLAFALVLSGNHVFTSGAGGTNAATIRGALRAERPDLLTVVLPQSFSKQNPASQDLLKQVNIVIEAPQNDHLPLDVASRLCNSDLLSRTDQLICFAFHDSNTIIETMREARALDMICTPLYLDFGGDRQATPSTRPGGSDAGSD